MAHDTMTSGSISQSSQTQQSSSRQAPPPAADARVDTALILWLVASVAIVGIMLVAARAFAPEWAANANEDATVLVAEVYAILSATLVVVFGSHARSATALRLCVVSGRAFALAFVVVMVVIGVVNLAYVLTGAGSTVSDAYLRLGTDGGRLGTIGPITTRLGLARAYVLVGTDIGLTALLRAARPSAGRPSHHPLQKGV
jgi:hypothetical protein